MMVHFGILGLKKIMLDPNMEKVVPVTKAEEKQPETGEGKPSTEPLTKVVLDT